MDAFRAVWGAARAVLLAAVAIAAAVGLGREGVRAHRENEREVRRLEDLDRQGTRLREENERLRAERRALDEDPAYVELLLRQSRMAPQGEKLLVK